MRLLLSLIFKASGWKIKGSVPPELKKYVLAVGPHTSNWDFPLGILVRAALRLKNARYLGKKSLFRFPYGWFFRVTGGYPVDRSAKSDMTTVVAESIKSSEYFILGIAPEGTRKKVEKLRTGFYIIAKKAGVPIVPIGMDYPSKTVHVGKPLYPGKDMNRDLEILSGFYKKMIGKNPELGL